MAMTAETTVVEEAEAVAKGAPNKRGEQLAFTWLDAKKKFVAASGCLQDTREDAREFMVLQGYEQMEYAGVEFKFHDRETISINKEAMKADGVLEKYQVTTSTRVFRMKELKRG